MVVIRRLMLVTLNRNEDDAGTKGEGLALTINVDGTDIVDKNYLVSDKSGKGFISEDFAPFIQPFESTTLTNSSIRLAIRSDNAWAPEHILVLGIVTPEEREGPILPVAMEVDQKIWLSTDPDEGHVSMPLRLVGYGTASSVIRRVLLLLNTEASGESGTDSPIEIEITAGGTVVLKEEIHDTPQDDLEHGATNLYFLDAPIPFTKADVLSNGKIKMSILGRDAWIPRRVFVYGFDTAEGRPTEVVDLVSIRKWTFGAFSKDATEGVPSRDLPLG